MEKVKEGESDLGLKRWLVPAACFAIGLIGFGSVQNWIFYSEASSRSQIEYQEAREQIAAECRLPVASSTCSTEIMDEAREEQRAEFDLYSQKAMALWTAIMGTMAIIGASLSAVGIYLIWRTWDATREAADNSRKTLNSYIHRERAILRLAHARFQKVHSPGFNPDGFQIEVVNFGPSPGEFVSVQWEYLEAPMWPDKLRYEIWPENISTSDGEAATPHLGADQIHEPECWLAVTLAYRTLGSEEYRCHRAYKIAYEQADAYGQGGEFYAIPSRIMDQPANT